MVSAMQAVEQGTAVSTAAAAFVVPRKTLDDRVKGRVKHGAKPGPDTVLTAEEDALMTYILYMAERGFPLTRTMTMAFAWAISKRTGILSQGQGSTGWAIFVNGILGLLCEEVTNLIVAVLSA